MTNAVQGQGPVQILQHLKNASPSNASTMVDLDSVGSADSSWDGASPHSVGSPQMHVQQQMYMMPEGPAPQQKLSGQGGQDQQQDFMPVPMMQTPYGLMPLQNGSPMSQGSPMGSQGAPMAMSPVATAAPQGMAMVSSASPQGMMMPIPSANGEGVQMIAVIPAGMTGMPGMGMQAIAMAPPQGYAMCQPLPENAQSPEKAPEKKKLLEDLLPGGVRRRAMREEHGRKVFVGGLNPSTSTEDLSEYFSKFGVVSHACVITDSNSKASRGFGFVEFDGDIPDGVMATVHIIDQRRCSVREYGQTTAA